MAILTNPKTGGILLDAPQNLHVNALIDYILEHELSDFEEYPSYTHPYFHAYACRFSGLSADMMLAQTLAELED